MSSLIEPQINENVRPHGGVLRTSSLAKGVLFGNFSRVRSRQGYAFGNFGQRDVKIR